MNGITSWWVYNKVNVVQVYRRQQFSLKRTCFSSQSPLADSTENLANFVEILCGNPQPLREFHSSSGAVSLGGSAHGLGVGLLNMLDPHD
jgi:hypothetical protein